MVSRTAGNGITEALARHTEGLGRRYWRRAPAQVPAPNTGLGVLAPWRPGAFAL